MNSERAQTFVLNPLFLFTMCLLLSTVWHASYGCEKHSDHSSHSDVLLILLQHKIKIQKLQTQFTAIHESEKRNIQLNLKKQASMLHKASMLLEKYLAIPETRYPNMDMYHQSLISRGGLLKEFAGLLNVFQQQSSQHFME